MRTHLLLAIATLAMTAPSALAVHGSPYTAYGVATLNGNVYDAVVEWTGYWNPTGPSNSFIVTISVPNTGEVLVNNHLFPGTWQSPCFCYGGTEFFFPYHAWDTANDVNFDIKGLQTLQINTGNQFMVYVGNYNAYELVLVVDDYHG